MAAPRRLVSDQVVVVLGASSGIGRATALEFARQGCTRIVVASRGEEALGTLVEELTREGAEAVAVPTDITDQAAVRALVDAPRRASAGSTPSSPCPVSASGGR